MHQCIYNSCVPLFLFQFSSFGKVGPDILPRMLFSNIKINKCFILALTLWLIKALMACNDRYTNRPLDSYYCNGGEYANLSDVTLGFCRWACLKTQRCRTISYSPLSGICLLASQPCVMAQKHEEFMLMLFRDLEHVDCTVWVQDMVGAVPDRILTTINYGHVGRVTSGGNTGSGNIPVDLLVGQANRPGENWKTYIAQGGRRWSSPTTDYWRFTLTVPWLGSLTQQEMYFLWMPLRRGCWQMAVVSIALSPTTVTFSSGLWASMLKETMWYTMHTPEALLSPNSTFWFLCNYMYCQQWLQLHSVKFVSLCSTWCSLPAFGYTGQTNDKQWDQPNSVSVIKLNS